MRGGQFPRCGGVARGGHPPAPYTTGWDYRRCAPVGTSPSRTRRTCSASLVVNVTSEAAANRVDDRRPGSRIESGRRCWIQARRRSGSVEGMQISGVRISPEYVRVLAEIVEGAGFPGTAGRLAQAIEQGVTTEAPLTTEAPEAILAALEPHCPAGLNRLRTELAKDERRRRRLAGGPG